MSGERYFAVRGAALGPNTATLLSIGLCMLLLAAGGFVTPVRAQERSLLDWDKWLNAEVVHIISAREREIFLQLKTEEQRERFAERFWQVRDPTPGTERNEYREEIDKRIKYADKMFRNGPGRGALTDRGRIYITLGPPRSVQTFPSGANTYPMELWFYQVSPSTGLPPFFYLIFFTRFGAGDYVLYNPVMDGPDSLLALRSPTMPASEALQEIDSELARAAYNYIPSGGGLYQERPSLSNLMLLAKLDQVKEMGIDPTYAERILLGEEVVTTEYTFGGSVPANVLFPSVDDFGRCFLDFAFQVEPEEIKLARYEDRIYGVFKVEYRIAAPDGLTVYSETDSAEFGFSPEEFEAARSKPLLYEKRIPCIPGAYNIDISLKNEVSKELFLFSKKVVVPGPRVDQFGASDILLARSLEKIERYDAAVVRPLQFADILLRADLGRGFSPGSQLTLYCLLFHPPQQPGEAPVAIKINYGILDATGAEILGGAQTIPLSAFSQNGLFHLFVRRALDRLGPGAYTVVLKIDAGAEGASLVRSAEFTVAPESPPEPTILVAASLKLDEAPVLLSLGRMWQLRGDTAQAEMFFLQALRLDPHNPKIYMATALLYFESSQYEKAVDMLQRMLIESPNDAGALRYLGLSYFQLGEYGKAARFFTRLILQEGESTDSLNMLGKAYYYDGEVDKAVDAWRRSLALDPEQEEIKRLIEEAGK
jgi:GWxTD domain-containing protein